MSARRAIITGAAGQDGHYMVDLLLARGYEIVGTVRQPAAQARHPGLTEVAVDLTDAAAFEALLQRTRPHEVYNLAAKSSGSGMYDDPVGIGEVNGLAVAKLLEAIRRVDVGIRFCQASSSEMFGEASQSPQDESTPLRPRSPYGVAKLYAHHMVRIYRERYGVFACSAILFNHESPLRRTEFVTRKVTRAAAAIRLGMASEITLGDLEARRDWGFAGDFMRAMWLMLQQAQGDDYVVAAGEVHSVRQLCEIAFSHVGLDYRQHVRTSSEFARPPEAVQLTGNAAKARKQLGWSHECDFRTMVCAMVDADLVALQSNSEGKASQS